MMSRKDFRLLADAVAQIDDIENRKYVSNLVASACSNSNSKFNLDTFLNAVENKAREIQWDMMEEMGLVTND
jgi:hypothetical protein